MNAGNKGVEKKHEDHHAEHWGTLHQQNLVCYSVLWKREKKTKHIFFSFEKLIFIMSDSICLKWTFKYSAHFITQIASMHSSYSERKICLKGEIKSYLLLQLLNILFPVFILLRNLSVQKKKNSSIDCPLFIRHFKHPRLPSALQDHVQLKFIDCLYWLNIKHRMCCATMCFFYRCMKL